MSGSLSLILDDDSGNFTYSGGEWTLTALHQWYNGTSWYPAFATGNVLGSFSLSFEGTSIAFIGDTPPVGYNQTAIITVDGGAPSIVVYGAPHSYMQWYKSPSLFDGEHSIQVDNLAMTAVDFAVITVGSDTPLAGKTAIVDDADPAVVYSSNMSDSGGNNWRESSAGFIAGAVPPGFPYGGSTHRSSAVGDSVTFRFTGTSISAYGIFNWANLGLLSATFTLDGGNPVSQVYIVTNSTHEFVNQELQAQNFLFFSFDDLPAANHTFIITIIECMNQEFVLDYITYTPSFSTLVDMPVVSPAAPGSINPDAISSSSPSPATTSNLISGGSRSTNINSSTAGAPSSLADSNSSNAAARIWVIVASVVGGLLLITLVVSLLLLKHRRRIETRLKLQTVTPFHGASSPSNSIPQHSKLALESSLLSTATSRVAIPVDTVPPPRDDSPRHMIGTFESVSPPSYRAT